MVLILWKAAKSSEVVRIDLASGARDLLSCTEFHSWVEFSLDMDIIPFAVPFRMKSAWDRGC